MRRVAALFILALVATFAADARAEVMDKEPALLEIWVWALVGSAVGLVAWRARWWLGLASALLTLPLVVALQRELRDPFVGPAIRAEAGPLYFWGAHAATVVLIGAQLVGAALSRRRLRVRPPPVSRS